MARYYWDAKSVLSNLSTLRKAIKKEKDPLKRMALEEEYDRINSAIYLSFSMPDSKLPLTKRIPKVFYSFLANQRYFELLSVFEDCFEGNIKEFDEAYKLSGSISDEIERATSTHVGRTKAVSICYDFYKELDDEFFEYFKNFYDQRFSHLRFLKEIPSSGLSTTLGQQHYIHGLNTSYVEVAGSNTPNMVLTLIHEVGHVLDNHFNPDNLLVSDFFYEVTSIFMELVAYYKKTGNFEDLVYHFLMANNIGKISCDSENGYDLNSLMVLYRDNNLTINDEFYKAAGEYGFNRKKVNSFVDSNIINDIVYPISLPLALYFFHIYKDDERKGLEELKKFLKTVERDNYIPLLKSDEVKDIASGEIKKILVDARECFKGYKK